MSLQKINDYDLLEIIGTGSYSTVHRARNKVNINSLRCNDFGVMKFVLFIRKINNILQ